MVALAKAPAAPMLLIGLGYYLEQEFWAETLCDTPWLCSLYEELKMIKIHVILRFKPKLNVLGVKVFRYQITT